MLRHRPPQRTGGVVQTEKIASLLELLSTWAPLEEEFPDIDDLEPIEDVDLQEGVSKVVCDSAGARD
jgi:hypothetical protein